MGIYKTTKLIRCICFILFITLVVIFVQRCTINMVSYGASGERRMSRIYELPKNSIDVVSIGGSTSRMAFSPTYLYNLYGFAGYNLGSSNQPVIASKVLLEEFFKRQSPKVIFIEVHNLTLTSNDVGFRGVIDSLYYSKEKISTINEWFINYPEKQGDSLISYLIPLFKYKDAVFNSSSYNKLMSFPEDRQPLANLGNVINVLDLGDNNETYGGIDTSLTDESEKIDEQQLDDFLEIIQLVQNNGATPVLYKTPVITNWNEKNHNAFKQIAFELGIDFIDFNTHDLIDALDYNYNYDNCDKVHTNVFGANKVTKYLGDYLVKNFGLQDTRNNDKYSHYRKAYDKYSRELFYAQLKKEKSMFSYLDVVLKTNQQNFTVIFSVKDTCQAKMGEEILSKLRSMGFKSDKVFDEYGHSFIGIWQNGNVIYEERSETINNTETDLLEYKGVLPDSMKYYVKSAGYRCGNISSIVINGTEYSKNSRGFNVVVYDNVTGRVVDSICWDTHVDAGITFKR